MNRHIASSIVSTALLSGFIWWILSDGVWASWIIGLPTILLIVGWNLNQGTPSQSLPRFFGLLEFLPYFLWESLRGGIDVARLALAPNMPIDPCFTVYDLRLPKGPAQRVFINTVSLLPGTLSADLLREKLIVHRLRGAPDDDQDLRECEQRVARLYGLTLTDADPSQSNPGASWS
ncbi:Na+/H+ antiporter subunit E [Halomonas sp. PR-M31]|uniref:Na+/H+ antiporter subunit E n=1 Tax=Halomonas sp. PR-M31 TaxID=1471202 RepID=UPI000650C798|nr:Na+/H+ antiporter subunit E [Halomonas sp. PR-M31]